MSRKIEAYIKAVNAGLSRKQISEVVGISMSAICAYAKRSGVSPVHGSAVTQPTERQQAIIAAYKSGLTLEETSQQFGITRERVRQIVTKFGHSEGRKRMTSKRVANLAKRLARQNEQNARAAEREKRKAEMIADYRAGMKFVDMMNKYGYAHITGVNNMLRYWGEPPRRCLKLSDAMKAMHARKKEK